MIRWLRAVWYGLRGVRLTLTSAEYRKLLSEMDRCPECAPLANEFCDEHDGWMEEFYP